MNSQGYLILHLDHPHPFTSFRAGSNILPSREKENPLAHLWERVRVRVE